MKPTLIIILERARAILKSALNRALAETALPAYLIEGILLDLLAEVRAQKAAEIASEYERTIKQMDPIDKAGAADSSGEKETKINDSFA